MISHNVGSNVNIPNVDHWFSKEAKTALFIALRLIKEASVQEYIKDLAKFSLSRIMVRISRQQSDIQYRAVEKHLDIVKIIEVIDNSLKDVKRKFSETRHRWYGRTHIVKGDSRLPETYQKIKNIDLVITSPPYPNAYEYWLYHKYRMFWLDLDPIWSRSNEIGARPFYSGTGKLNEFDFQNDIKLVLNNLYKVCKTDAIQFWVVGDSIIKGRTIDNSGIIENACKLTGWEVVDKISRDLCRKRSSFQGIGRQKKEDILVITKK